MEQDNITFILSSQLKELRQDMKTVRDTLAPMSADLKYHILRTDLNESRIESLESRLLEAAEHANRLAEKRMKIFQIGIGILVSAIALGTAIGKWL